MSTVRALRQAKGWSQQTLASNAGVGIQTIIKIEKGQAVIPSIANAVRQALGASNVDIVVYNRVTSAQNSK